MPRVARVVIPEVAHHVTQRGTGRQMVFYTRGDRVSYLRLLKENSERAGLRILAYCLMPNHIHLIAAPREAASLAVALRRAHGRYAQYFNARKLRSGHLWQNRFYSCPMDEHHLWTAMRYVEMNPVRAGLAARPEEWEWSSAAAHLGGSDSRHLLDMGFWKESGGSGRWRELLEENEQEQELNELRRATYAGKPLGSREFHARIEVMRKKLKQEEDPAMGRFDGGLEAGDNRYFVAV